MGPLAHSLLLSHCLCEARLDVRASLDDSTTRAGSKPGPQQQMYLDVFGLFLVSFFFTFLLHSRRLHGALPESTKEGGWSNGAVFREAFTSAHRLNASVQLVKRDKKPRMVDANFLAPPEMSGYI